MDKNEHLGRPLPLLSNDQSNKHGNSGDNKQWDKGTSQALFDKQLHQDTYAYTTHWLTKLGINYNLEHTGYYPEEPTTFHLSKTFHNIYPLEWDAVDFETVHDAGKWLDKRSKEVSKQQHLRKVSDDMGNHANSAIVAEFVRLSAEYHATPKDKLSQGESDE